MSEKFDKIGLVSSLSVKKNTKKSWDQWIEILNQAGASAWTHQEIVAYLVKKHRLSLWWQQQVTTGYEIAIERRIPGQNLAGKYSTTVTKSINKSVAPVWKFLFSESGLELWLKPITKFALLKQHTFETLDGAFGEVRTLKAGSRVRMTWQESEWPKHTVVQVHVVAKGQGRCMIVIQHENIPNPQMKTELKSRWKTAIDELGLALNS